MEPRSIALASSSGEEVLLLSSARGSRASSRWIQKLTSSGASRGRRASRRGRRRKLSCEPWAR
jgi:hypothetical protein